MSKTERSRHLVDPELLPMLEQFPTVTVTSERLEALRNRPPWGPVNPDDVARSELESRSIPGPQGDPDVPIRIYRPVGTSERLPTILHIHGGGFIAGDAAQNEGVHRPLAADLSCCIVSVNYRLAPETPYPGPLEDCYAALDWIMHNAEDIGVDSSRVGLMGESAGGGLAAALALLARDRGQHTLAFQHLIYPMLDDRTCTRDDPHPYTGEYIWNADSNRYGWTALLGHAPGGPDVSPYAAPARALDLRRLPPTYLATAALDLFLEENLDYASRLTRAGVPVELHVYPGSFHAFNAWPAADVSARARRDSKAALARALGRDL